MDQGSKPGSTKTALTTSPSSPGDLMTSRPCPCCGGEVLAEPVFTTPFCGLRIAARCPRGCIWSNEEQLELDRVATEEVYG